MGLEKKIIKQLLQKEDPVVLELGANCGSDTQQLLDEFRDIRIYCFEPDPRNIKRFKKYIDDNRCLLEEAAVSNRDGQSILHMSTGWPVSRYSKVFGLYKLYGLIGRKEWTASSSIKDSVSHSEDWPWLTFNKVATVKAIKLDTWLRDRNIGCVDFIWMDIQGAERDMIEGAVDTLKITRFLYTEYGATSSYPEAMTREETIEIMRQHNFELMPEYSSDAQVKTGDLLFRNRAFNSPAQARLAPTKEWGRYLQLWRLHSRRLLVRLRQGIRWHHRIE